MLKKIIKYGLVTLAWLLLWQIAAQLVNESLLLPGPISVGARICELCATLDFYKAIATSLARVVAGIFIGVVIGALAGQPNINTLDLLGVPTCPCCGNQFGFVVCECGNIFCVGEEMQNTCPWCGTEGTLTQGSAEGMNINRTIG